MSTTFMGWGADSRFEVRLRAVLEQTLRILTKMATAKLMFVDDLAFPAATKMDERTVLIQNGALRKVRSNYEKTKLAKGLLYHESAHLFWSLDGSGLALLANRARLKGISFGEYRMAYNVLDDKRIENLFVKRYSPAKAYFAIPLSEFILSYTESDMDDLGTNEVIQIWAGAVGRPWLGATAYNKLRTYVMRRTTDAGYPNFVTDSEDIVKRYLTVSRDDFAYYAGMAARAKSPYRLIEDWIALLASTRTVSPEACAGDHQENRDNMLSDRPAEDQQKGAGDALNDDEADETLHPSDSPADDAEEDADGDAGNGDIADDSDDGDGEGESGTAASSSSDSTGTEDVSGSSVIEATQEAAEEAEDALEGDVDETLDAVLSKIHEVDASQPSSVKPIWNTHIEGVSSDMSAISRRIAAELQDIRNQAAAEWLRGTDVGRLNASRDLLFGDERMDVFDLFDEGTEDDMHIHVLFGIDQSFSMAGGDEPFRHAAKTAWIFREAFERLDHTVDVYGYDDEYQRLDEPHRRTSYYVRRPNGSTYPQSMLKEMVRLSLAKRDVSGRLMVILTDGSWGVTTEAEHAEYVEILAPFRKAGGIALLFALESNETAYFKGQMDRGIIHDTEPYGFNSWAEIMTPGEVVEPTRGFVKQLMAQHLRR